MSGELGKNLNIYQVHTDLEGNYTYCNQQYVTDFGYLYTGEIVGKPAMLAIVQKDREPVEQIVKKALTQPHKPFQIMLTKVLEGGEVRDNLWEFTAVENSHGVLEMHAIGLPLNVGDPNKEDLNAFYAAFLRQEHFLNRLAQISKSLLEAGNTYPKLHKSLSILGAALSLTKLSFYRCDASSNVFYLEHEYTDYGWEKSNDDSEFQKIYEALNGEQTNTFVRLIVNRESKTTTIVSAYDSYYSSPTEFSALVLPIYYGNILWGRLIIQEEEIHNPLQRSFLRSIEVFAENIGLVLERIQTQREFDDAKQLLSQTGEIAKIGGWEYNVLSNKLTWTDEARNIHGVESDVNPTLEEVVAFYHKKDRDRIEKMVSEALLHGKSYRFEAEIVNHKGKKKWIRDTGYSEFGDGKCIKLYGTIQDITKDKETQLKLQASRQETDEIIEALNSSSLVSFTDRKGKILKVNSTFAEVSGYSKDELVGKDHRIINSGYHSKDFFKDLWETILSGKVWKGEIKNKRKDGTFYWVSSVINPIRDEHGKVSRFLSIRQDITQQKLYEKKLNKLNQRLNEAQERAQIGHWHVNVQTGELFWSDVVYEIFGYDKQSQNPSQSSFFHSVHPDDKELLYEAQIEAQQTGRQNVVHRIVRPDGQIRYVHELSDATFDEQGKLLHLSGTVQDVTAIQEQKEKLLQQEFDLEAVVSSLDDIVFILDEDYVFRKVWTNNEDILYVKKSDIENRSLYEVVPKHVSELVLESIDSTLLDGKKRCIEYEWWNGDQQKYFEATIRKIEAKIENKEVVSILVHDITDKHLQKVDVLYKEKLLSLLAKVQKRLLIQSNQEDAIGEILRLLATEWNVQSSCYFKIFQKNESVFLHKQFEYNNESSQIYRFENNDPFLVRSTDTIIQNILGGSTFQTKAESISKDSIFYKLAVRKKLKSLILVPVVVDGEARNLIVFGSNDHKKEWSESEVNFLNTVADSLSSASIRNASLEGIKASEENLRQIIDALPNHIFVKNDAGKYLLANKAFADENNIRRNEIIGLTDYDIGVPNSTANQYAELDRKVIKTNKPVLINEEKVERNAKVKWYKSEKIPYVKSGSSERQVLTVSTDVTNLKLAEQHLRESEVNLLETQRVAKIGRWEFNLVNNKLTWSDTIYDIFEFSPSIKPDYDTFLKAIHPEDRERVNSSYFDSVKNRTPYDIEHRIEFSDGTIKWIREYCRTEYDGALPIRSIGVVQDITHEKQAQFQIEAIKKRLDDIVNNVDSAMWSTDLDGNYLFMNDATYSITGYTKNDWLKNPDLWKEIYPEKDYKNVAIALKEVLTKGFYEYEQEITTKSGAKKWVIIRKKLGYDVSGNPIRIDSVSTDISPAKNAELALEKAFEVLYRTNKVARVGGWEVKIPSNVVTWTEVAKEIYEVDSDFAPSVEKTYDFYPDRRTRHTFKKAITNLSTKGQGFDVELNIRTAKGNSRWVRVIGQAEKSRGNLVRLYGTVQDIDAWKKSEFKIRRQNQYRKLIAEISSAFVKMDSLSMVGIFKDALKLIGNYFEVDRAFLVQFDEGFLHVTERLNWVKSQESSNRMFLEGRSIDEFPWFKEQILSNNTLVLSSFENIPDYAVNEQQAWQSQNLKSTLISKIVLVDKPEAFLGIADTTKHQAWTEIQQSELKVIANIFSDALLKIKLELAAKRAKEIAQAASTAKSEFLANMSHEIRTPLNGVIGFTELLASYDLEPQAKQFASYAHSSAHALLELVNNVLDFSKIESGKMELDLTKSALFELIDEVVDVFRLQATKKNIELLVSIDSDLPRFLYLDALRIKQVLFNLLGNALKFTIKGEIELSVGFTKISELEGTCSFSVRDTGIGISEENQRKLFQAFSQADYSITRKFGGTGLGLSISKSLVEKMGGELSMLSEEGFGSTFSFSIVTKFEELSTPKILKKMQIDRVLIIDDNEKNLLILKTHLEHTKIKCTIVKNALSALEILNSDTNFDAIIVDYKMPFMNGIDFIKKLRSEIYFEDKNFPKTILLSSGNVSQKFHDEVSHVLMKPVKTEELLASLFSDDEAIVISNNFGSTIQEISNKKIETTHIPRVLVVDDVELNHFLTDEYLRVILNKVEVIQAFNGKMAIEKFRESKPDLILMDLHMPILDGIEATKEIRALEVGESKLVPIVALTADVISNVKASIFECGMTDLITKPVQIEELNRIVTQYVKDIE